MYKVLKVMHLVGLTLFLGSIFGHILSGALHGVEGSPDAIFARQSIHEATRWLTVPGLWLTIASGIGMAVVGRLPVLRLRWLAVHAGLALGIVLMTVFLIVPAVTELMSLTPPPPVGHPDHAAYVAAKRTESVGGAFNVLLILAAVAIGAIKPTLARYRAGVRSSAKG